METTEHYCPNGCEWEDNVGVLLNVHRDKWGYADGYQCPECGEKFRTTNFD